MISSDIPLDLSGWTSWSQCSASCISEDSFPIKTRKTCGLDARRKECINESRPCKGYGYAYYKTCPLGMLYEYESFMIRYAFCQASRYLG